MLARTLSLPPRRVVAARAPGADLQTEDRTNKDRAWSKSEKSRRSGSRLRWAQEAHDRLGSD